MSQLAVPSLLCVPSKQLRKCRQYRVKDPEEHTSHSSSLSPAPWSLSPRFKSQIIRAEFKITIQIKPTPHSFLAERTAAAPSRLLALAQNWVSGGVCAPVN